MSIALNAIDEKIAQGTAEVARLVDVMHKARALRVKIEDERRQAQGRLLSGDRRAAADLSGLADELIAARRGLEEAERAVEAARAALSPLARERQRVVSHELAAHLNGLLDVRAAQAAQVDAAIEALAAAINAYSVTVSEANALAALVYVGSVRPTMHAWVAQRLIAMIRPTLPSEFPWGTAGTTAVRSVDDEAMKPVRAAVDRELAAAPAVGASAERG